MAASYNHITIIGNAGSDAELNVTNNGEKYAKFSVAVNEYAGKGQDGKPVYKTTWFPVTAWKGLAEIAEKLVEKGNPYLVAGRLTINSYTDKNGNPRTNVNIIASEVVPVGTKKEEKSETHVDDNFLPSDETY
jgi:single-strand DNA-binding protein